MNKLRTITAFGIILIILSIIFLFNPSNKNETFYQEVLEVVESNKYEYEHLAKEILRINRFINREELQIEKQIPNEISIDMKESGVSKSINGTRLGLPENENENKFYNRILETDSLNHSSIKSMKMIAEKLELYKIEVDMSNTVTFELLKCYAPIECNVYHLKYNSKIKKENSDIQITEKLHLKTISKYYQ